MEVSKDSVTFYGKSINTGETVSGWYWENRGDGYIITRDEGIQPPLFRTRQQEECCREKETYIIWDYDFPDFRNMGL